MPDVTVKRIEDMEAIWGGSFVRARASPGASAFGMNIWNFPPDWDQYWEHNHVDAPADDHEEEVYTALTGKATLHVGGEQHEIKPGVFARVAPPRSAGSRRQPRESSSSASALPRDRSTRHSRSSSWAVLRASDAPTNRPGRGLTSNARRRSGCLGRPGTGPRATTRSQPSRPALAETALINTDMRRILRELTSESPEP